MGNDPRFHEQADQAADMAVAAERAGHYTRATLEFTRAAGLYEAAQEPGVAEQCRQRAETASVA